MLRIFSLIIILLSLFSCKSENSEDVNAETAQEQKVQLPAGFHDFYDEFHIDSVFQMAHVAFPLKGRITKIDSIQEMNIDMEYEAADWKLHRPFVQDGSYNRSFAVLGDMVIENISDNMGLLNIERRWAKLDSVYNLIYYGTTEKSW